MEQENRRGFFEAAYLGDNQFWRYLVVLLLVILGYFIGQLPFLVTAVYQTTTGAIDADTLQQFQETADMGILGLDYNVGLFLLLLAFAVGLVFLCLGVQFVHRRSWKTMVNYAGRFNFSKILYGFAFWLFLAFLAEVPFLIMHSESYEFQFEPVRFFVLLIIALSILPLQTTMEEFFFRGWLMQGFGLVFGARIFPLLVSSLLFGLIHMANPEVANYGLVNMMTYYIMAGLFLGLITILDDSLDLALGVHFATNFYAAVFVTYEHAALKTWALFRYTEELNVGAMNIAFFVLALVFILLASKKFNWDFNIVFQKVVKPKDDDAV